MSITFTEAEHQICTVARMIEEEKIYYVTAGGPPLLSMLLAMKRQAPKVTYVLENGTIGPKPVLPLDPFMTLISSKSDRNSVMWTSMNVANWFAANGYFEYGILGGIQIDPYGNFNSGFLGGDYYHPKRRFGGPGGATEIAALCWKTIIMTDQHKRKFVKQTDFVSSPGYLDGSPDARQRAGMPKGTGPYRVVTGQAMFGYDDQTRRMKLLSVAPWLTVENVLAEMDFEPMMADPVTRMVPPTEEELDLLRVQIDPAGQTIAKGEWVTF
jgi:glutaconate CoA-transferase, subunit B